MQNTTQYGILTKSSLNGKTYIEMGNLFDMQGQAEDYIIGDAAIDTSEHHLAIVAVDLLTGATSTVLGRDGIEKLIDDAQQAKDSEESAALRNYKSDSAYFAASRWF